MVTISLGFHCVIENGPEPAEAVFSQPLPQSLLPSVILPSFDFSSTLSTMAKLVAQSMLMTKEGA